MGARSGRVADGALWSGAGRRRRCDDAPGSALGCRRGAPRYGDEPVMPGRRLGLLSSDSLFDVRWEVAQHASCDAGTLNKMSYDSEPGVRELVARHERCAAETLRRLATDPFERARVAAAANPACPELLLRRLGTDPDEKVREAARRALLERGRLSVP